MRHTIAFVVVGVLAVSAVAVVLLGRPDAETGGRPTPPGPARPSAPAAPPGAAPAQFALRQAHDEALAAPADALSPEILIQLARCLSLFDREQARAVLRVADSLLSAAEANAPAAGEREPGAFFGNFTHQSALRLKLGAAAVPVDVEMARTCFEMARDSSRRKSPADELLATTAGAAVLILDGDSPAALRLAADFCRRTPSVLFEEGGCGLERPSKTVVGTMLLYVDPKLAADFASRLDAQFHAETLIAAAEIVAPHSPQLVLEYCRRAGKLASDAPRANWRDAALKQAALGLSADHINEALELTDAIAAGGARSVTRGDCLALLAETDLDRALALATQDRPTDEESALVGAIARTAIPRDPASAAKIFPTRGNAHQAGYVLTDVAVELAERGDMDEARKLADMIAPAIVRAPCLARLAGVIGDQDRTRALAILEEAFQLALADDPYGRVAAEVSQRTALLDRDKGGEYFRRALEEAFAACQARGTWSKYYRLAEALATVDAPSAMAALERVPELVVGDSTTDPGVLNRDMLPELAVANSEFAMDALDRMFGARHNANRMSELVRKVAVKTGLQSDEQAARFLELLPDDHQRESVRREIAEARLTQQLVADPTSAVEVLEALDAQTASQSSKVTVIGAAVRELEQADREAAIELCEGLPDDRLRDECLSSLAYDCRDNADDVARLTGLIDDPGTRVSALVGIGRRLARDVPEWRALLDLDWF